MGLLETSRSRQFRKEVISKIVRDFIFVYYLLTNKLYLSLYKNVLTSRNEKLRGLFLCLTQGMYGLEKIVLRATLCVVPLLVRNMSAVLIENIVRFSFCPVSILRPLVTFLPSPVTFRRENILQSRSVGDQ